MDDETLAREAIGLLGTAAAALIEEAQPSFIKERVEYKATNRDCPQWVENGRKPRPALKPVPIG